MQFCFVVVDSFSFSFFLSFFLFCSLSSCFVLGGFVFFSLLKKTRDGVFV